MSKKIGLVTTKEGVVSGVTIVMEQVATGLRERGYDVNLIRPQPTILNKIKVVGYILQYALLNETFRNYDILLGNGVGLVGAVDLSVTKIDTIHSTSSGANEALAHAYSNLAEDEKAPLESILQRICGATITDLPESFSTKESAFEIDKIVAASADKVVTISSQITEEVKKHFMVPAEKMISIPNAVAPFWFDSQGEPSEKPRIIYAGRAGYTPINIFLKGLDRVHTVFESFPDAEMLCILHVGNPDFMPTFEAIFPPLRVELYMNLQQQEIAEHYRVGDIFLNSSRYEAFGLSLIESMAAGLVPITFSTGVVSEIIEDGVNGFVVSNATELHNRVAELLENPEKARDMGRAASETIAQRFSMKNMIDGYENLLNSL
jgi:glycosyltransferase involved in cell wall biosynthesis